MHHQSTLIDQTIEMLSKRGNWIKKSEHQQAAHCLLGGIGSAYLQSIGRTSHRDGVMPYKITMNEQTVIETANLLAQAIKIEFPGRYRYLQLCRVIPAEHYHGSAKVVMMFNDHRKTTHGDVLVVLERAKQLALKAESQEIADALAAKQRIEEIRAEAHAGTLDMDRVMQLLQDTESAK